jgi:hypothetical protein
MSDNVRDELEAFSRLWDKAIEDGIFEDETPAPKAQIQVTSELDGLEGYEEFDDEPEGLIQERAGQGDPYFAYLNFLKTEGSSPNPVYPDSPGGDSERPKAVWTTSQKNVDEMSKLKQRLYELECKLNAKEAGGEKWVEKAAESHEDEKLFKQIHAMKTKLDELSNKLGLGDEPKASMYGVEK